MNKNQMNKKQITERKIKRYEEKYMQIRQGLRNGKTISEISEETGINELTIEQYIQNDKTDSLTFAIIAKKTGLLHAVKDKSN